MQNRMGSGMETKAVVGMRKLDEVTITWVRSE